jgi:WD40 repeat protein
VVRSLLSKQPSEQTKNQAMRKVTNQAIQPLVHSCSSPCISLFLPPTIILAVRLWDPSSGELLSTLRGHTKGVWACKFYPVGHTSALLATAGEDATCRLWDTRTRYVCTHFLSGMCVCVCVCVLGFVCRYKVYFIGHRRFYRCSRIRHDSC